MLPITKLISSLFFFLSSRSENLSKKYYYGWRTWHIEMPVDAEGWLEFCCRTWDNANNTQPTYVRSAWYVSFFFFVFHPSIHPSPTPPPPPPPPPPTLLGTMYNVPPTTNLLKQELRFTRDIFLSSRQNLLHQSLSPRNCKAFATVRRGRGVDSAYYAAFAV